MDTALHDVRVVEMAGLAPSPFCGMILADFGADVIRIDRPAGGQTGNPDTLCRGKRSIAINIKHKDGVEILKKIVKSADVLIEPFRKGVMEKLGLGPSDLRKENPRLIYARMTGFGQGGPLSERAGHDINYLAVSGVLSSLGRRGDKPYAPVNFLADFAGGGMICALGVLMALYNRTLTGLGQVVDANMVEGAAYVGSFLWTTRNVPVAWIGEERGTGLLDGACPWYDTYETKDGQYMSVGAIEPQFYVQFIKGLGLEPKEHPQYDDWPKKRKLFTEIFKSKSQKEWSEQFEDCDSCVYPVVPFQDVSNHHHNKAKGSFRVEPNGAVTPRGAPRMSRTPARDVAFKVITPGEHTETILQEFGYGKGDIEQFKVKGTVHGVAPKEMQRAFK